jgi:hypothetical protein
VSICGLAGRSVVVVERDTAGSQASGRAAGVFKSVQGDELRTVLARVQGGAQAERAGPDHHNVGFHPITS